MSSEVFAGDDDFGLIDSELATAHLLDDHIGSGLVHALAVFATLPAAVALLYSSVRWGATRIEIFSIAIYSVSLIAVFAASAVYHLAASIDLCLRGLQEASTRQIGLATMPFKVFVSGLSRRWYRKLDHACIFVFYAGAATPILVSPRAPEGSLSALVAVWALAGFGVLFEIIVPESTRRLRTLLHIASVLCVAYVMAPAVIILPEGALLWLMASFAVFALGFLFFVSKWLPWNHTVWHLAVCVGAACHVGLVLQYVVRTP
jgi:hemolysin III